MKKIDEIINKAVSEYNNMTDYELRKKLSGCGIFSAIYAKQFYDVGTENYKYLCSNLTDRLSEILKKASEGVKKYNIEAVIKVKGNSYKYLLSEYERTENEAMQRAKENNYYSPISGKKIKPIFEKLEVKEAKENK